MTIKARKFVHRKSNLHSSIRLEAAEKSYRRRRNSKLPRK